jgi:hypothetical protein
MKTINGYCYVNGDVSSDISPKGSKRPIYERIRHGALAVSPNLYINGHHTGATSAFAFGGDGTAKASWGRHGLRFDATLPNTTAGRDVLKALTDGLRLGVSVEFTDAHHEIVDGLQELVSGTLAVISLTRPGMAYYSKGAVWLSDTRADTLPKDVQALRNHWLTAPVAPRNASKQSNDSGRFEQWLAFVRERGMTLADLQKEGFLDAIVAKARAAGLK